MVETTGPAKEQRRHPRQECRLTVTFRQIRGGLSGDGQVVNLSPGGVLLMSGADMASGTLLEIDFPENVFSGAARTLQGVVRWIGTRTGNLEYAFGTMFVEIKKPDRRRGSRRAEKLVLHVRCVDEGLFHESEPRAAVLGNVSEGGMEILTTCRYPAGTKLQIALPESPLGPGRTLFGRVKWNRSAEKMGHFNMGIRLG